MKMLRITLLVLILGIGQLAESYAARIKLRTSGAVVDDNLGQSVSISGNYAIVGVPNDDSDIGNESGSARIFVRSDAEWVQQQKLIPNDTGAGDRFGLSVAMNGNYAIVGAPGKIIETTEERDIGKSAGAAYIFVRRSAGWTQQAKLVSDDLGVADFFGISVSLDGDTAIVGAYKHNWPRADGGAVYVFVRNGEAWTQQQKLTPDDTQQFDFFGYAISISGNSAIVGSIRSDRAGNDSGAAYIFVRDGTSWTQQARVVGNNTGREDRFGFSVDISGNLAIVGCPKNGKGGAAYIFEREGIKWVQRKSRFQKRIIPAEKADGAEFGYSVAINGERAVIGAKSAGDSGAVYIFTATGGLIWEQQAKLTANDSTSRDEFGLSVGISENRLITGAPGHSSGGPNSGAAYIFELEEAAWRQQSKLSDSETAAEDQFGYAVAIGENFAVVGARQDDDGGSNAGAAYIFGRRGINWTRQAKLIANDVAPGDLFGYSAAISGETALIGAFGQDVSGPDSGAAYVFVLNGNSWIQQAKLVPSDIERFDHFGASLSIDGDTAIIGAFGKSSAGRDSGAAYIFVRSGASWTQQAKLLPSSPVAGDMFGFSVAINRNTAIVGAHKRDKAGEDSGAVYIFVRNGISWTQQTELIPDDVGIGDEFGFAVSINDNTIVIGAPKEDRNLVDIGSAYVFLRRGASWIQQVKLTASDAEAGDEFGSAVAISGDTAIVGAFKDDHDSGGGDNGSAYTFLRSDLSWGEKKRITAGSSNLFDLFGLSVSISGPFAIVGAHGNDDAGRDSGSAYIFNPIDLGFLPEGFPFSVDPSSRKKTTLGQIKQTALLQNYPNPFNPETWLPYALAKKASVIIRIYDIKGRMVRELNLGIQKAGGYFSKENAAYWDGRDELGHTVSSGIYFYTLTAEDFQATRRMIILK
ncbi:T9SS type A sorting domain-containing protein [Candidatus Poribacteria bacterium]|nr:T9SS type A sorting domain-containing protein [Candidatus Poribacteria bacterium]